MYTRSDWSSWYEDSSDNYAERYMDWDCSECGTEHKGDLVFVGSTTSATCGTCDAVSEW